MKRPNVLFILTDQQRYDALSCRESSIVKTPNLDKLASQGMRFENAYTAIPLCVPARWSLLTGQYAYEHKVFINEHVKDERTQTWADILRDNDYQTYAFGKSHGIHKGFERIEPAYGKAYDLQSGPLLKEPQLFDDWPNAPWPHGRTVAKSVESKDKFFDYKTVEQVNTKLCELRNTEKPWAMQVGIFYPHPPYILPEPYASMYNPDDIDLAEFDRGELANKPDGQTNMHDKFFDLPKEKQQQMVAGYYGSVSMADDCIGLILNKLEELGIADNTIICFTSDHGDLNSEHGLFSKFSSCYDAEARVPMIWRYPGVIAEGTVVNELVETIDLVPTLLELTGNEIPHTNSGKSLLPILKSEKREEPHREFVTAVTGWHEFRNLRPFGHMLRTPRWKLVYYPDEKSELYDTLNDPKEIKNLYYENEFAQIANDLKEKLLDSLIKTTSKAVRA